MFCFVLLALLSSYVLAVNINSSTSDMKNGAVVVAIAKEELTFAKIHEILGREILLDFNERKKLKNVAEEPLIIL